jgi:hypothetical protein
LLLLYALAGAAVPFDIAASRWEIRNLLPPPQALIPVMQKTVQDVDEKVPIMRAQTQSESIDRMLLGR